jgi:phenylacetate-coenzyme A ligase PaaK-like adenylate-forming protein
MTATTMPLPAGELLARDSWPRERLLAFQRARLRETLAHAVAASPYYREALGPDAPDRPLATLPTLTKATLMEQWERIVSGSGHRTFTTSGASGMRGAFAYGQEDWAIALASCLRGMLRLGAGPDTRVIGIGAPPGSHMSAEIFAAFQAGRPDSPRLSVLDPLEEIVDALNAFRPQALMGYPTIAARLAGEQLAGRLRIAPRLFAFGSEPLTEDVRARVREAWGVEPAEYYASTELPLIASSTLEHPRALELCEDMAVFENVDADNRPVPAGTPGAKLLVTTLANRALPLIRYELPDRVTIAPEPNPAGRPYAHLSRIEGRAADTLTLPARDGGTVEIAPLRFSRAFARRPEVRGHQVVLHPGRLELRVVLAPGAAPEPVAAAVADALDEAGAAHPPVAVTPVEEIEREPGAAKLKLVVDRRGNAAV